MSVLYTRPFGQLPESAENCIRVVTVRREVAAQLGPNNFDHCLPQLHLPDRLVADLQSGSLGETTLANWQEFARRGLDYLSLERVKTELCALLILLLHRPVVIWGPPDQLWQCQRQLIAQALQRMQPSILLDLG